VKYLKKYKLFESSNPLDIFKDIMSLSYIIEDEGYTLKYFTKESYPHIFDWTPDDKTDISYFASSKSKFDEFLSDHYTGRWKIVELNNIFIEIIDSNTPSYLEKFGSKSEKEKELMNEYFGKLKSNLPECNVTLIKSGSIQGYCCIINSPYIKIDII
jgi:hypothetical protein